MTPAHRGETEMIILQRDDFSGQPHPFFWEELLEDVIPNELPDSRNDYPDSVVIWVAKAEAN